MNPHRELARRWTTVSGNAFRFGAAITCFTLLALLAGCSRAPSINILGSLFPSWMLCGLIGILLTAIASLIFARMKIDQHLSPRILVYPCLAAFFTFTLWLLFFS